MKQHDRTYRPLTPSKPVPPGTPKQARTWSGGRSRLLWTKPVLMSGGDLCRCFFRNGWTVTRAAELLGLSRQTLYDYRAGRTPIPRVVELALAALELGVRDYPPDKGYDPHAYIGTGPRPGYIGPTTIPPPDPPKPPPAPVERISRNR